jgi:hypothetical protein
VILWDGRGLRRKLSLEVLIMIEVHNAWLIEMLMHVYDLVDFRAVSITIGYLIYNT